MRASAPRILVASPASGVGKTTLTCGLLQALKRRGLKVAACKCGPDFIDPMFHREVIGAHSCNLDLFLAGEQQVRALLAGVAHEADVTVIEGAMGYYDGIAQSDAASAYDVARVTGTPAVLVVDGHGRALSVCAEVRGFMGFRTPSQVAGVILNQVSPSYAPTMAAMIERECGVAVLGYVPQLDEAVLPSRHLGLVGASELADLQQKVDAVAHAIEQAIDLDCLLALAAIAPELDVGPRNLMGSGALDEMAPRASSENSTAQRTWQNMERHLDSFSCTLHPSDAPLEVDNVPRPLSADEEMGEALGDGSFAQRPASVSGVAVRAEEDSIEGEPVIAVAWDEAFNFYYPETLTLFERLGARLALFSPLKDEALPQGACGLYLGGGYPELHAQRLSENRVLREQIAHLIAEGLPTIAECGGFLYLHQTMTDAEEQTYPMVGAVPGHCFGRDRLGHFGYVTLTAAHDSLLAYEGETLPAHEFHYWQSNNPGMSFHARKPQSERAWDCVVATRTLYAGFPHLYLAAQPRAALRFVRACKAYGSAGGAC